MRITNKRILLVSPEPWSRLSVSKHHYAIHLASRGNKVFFLNPPSSKFEISDAHDSGVKVLDYRGFPKGLKYFPRFIIGWFTNDVFRKLERLAHERFDILWSFDNSVFYQMDALPEKILCISHIVDLNMDFQTSIAAQTASICFCNSGAIKSRLDRFTDKAYFVNHGFFLPTREDPEYIKVETKAAIKVGYAGNLDIQYLDWKMIKEVADSHPDIDFFFAGTMSAQKVKNLFGESENMHHVGILPAQVIQSFYDQMDVLILAYLADEYQDQLANPHKVLEYLYSGKPLVASFTQEYKGKELMYMSDKNAEWPSLFDYVINNLAECSSKELTDKRKNYALENTYDKQIDRIEKLLASLLDRTSK